MGPLPGEGKVGSGGASGTCSKVRMLGGVGVGEGWIGGSVGTLSCGGGKTGTPGVGVCPGVGMIGGSVGTLSCGACRVGKGGGAGVGSSPSCPCWPDGSIKFVGSLSAYAYRFAPPPANPIGSCEMNRISAGE